MGNGAQVTLFIILGLVILLLFGLILYWVSAVVPKQAQIQTSTIQNEQAAISGLLEGFLEDAGRRGVYRAGSHGGYIAPEGDEEYTESNPIPDYDLYFYAGSSFPFVLNNEKVSLLSKQQIEERISDYVAIEFNKAVNSSNAFKNLQKPSMPIVKTMINLNDVVIMATYPVKAKKAGAEIIASDVSVSIPVRFGLVYSIAAELVNSIKNNQYYDISKDCSKYGDGKINIYLLPGKDVELHAVRVVDAQPLYQKFYAPFEFRIGIKNKKVQGECVG